MSEIVFDIEANGLNPDKIHCAVAYMVWQENWQERDKLITCTSDNHLKQAFSSCTKDDYLIGHNIIRYDIPVLERILDIDVKATFIDTLALSWYLYPERNKHGLADWGEEFGIPKPVIEDWDNLTKEEYVHRCEEDVKINTMLWHKQRAYLSELYGNAGFEHLIEYLSFKMRCAMLQEQNKWQLDTDKAYYLYNELTEKQQEALKSLQGVMPAVEVLKKVRRPAKPFRIAKKGEVRIINNMTYSVSGARWKDICDMHSIDFDNEDEHKIPNGYKPPKATSPQQIKDWLFSLGWSPQTFKYLPDGEDENGRPKQRAIPQVKKGDDLCPSVLKLVKVYPELKYLEDLGVVGHRRGLVSGLLKVVDRDGCVIAAIQGLTNTLRFKHAVCVNIPSSRMPYGSEIRGLLTASKGMELCGSDMSSLEDRTKQHYMMPIDPDYVNEMNKDGFDPHLDIAVEAGFLTEGQADAYKTEDFNVDSKAFLSAQRHKGKTTNYASTYGAGAATIARGADATLKEGKALHKAYWDRNWSLKAIADDQETKTVNGMMWLYNPVSKFWYVLRSKKDIFSTLNQGTGTYCFDMWVKEVLKKDVKLVGQFHDEIIFRSPPKHRKQVTKYLKECVSKVNDMLQLNRDLDVDVDYGNSYADIH